MPRAKEDRILLAAARGKWRGRPRRVQSRAAAGFKCPAGPPAPAPQSQARSPRPLAPDRPRGPAQRKPTAHPPAEMPAPGSLLLCPGLGTRSAPQLQGPPQPGAAHSLPAGTESGIPHFSALRDDPIRQSQLFLRRLPVRRSGGPDTDEKLMHAGGLELMLRGPHITPLSTGVPWGAGWGGRGGGCQRVRTLVPNIPPGPDRSFLFHSYSRTCAEQDKTHHAPHRETGLRIASRSQRHSHSCCLFWRQRRARLGQRILCS